MAALLPLMIVPLLVWIGVWGYLWALDAKVSRLESTLRQTPLREDEDE